MAIQYFDALAGAGKTRALCNYAKKLAMRGEWVLFAQPSKKLIDATIRDEIGVEARLYEVRCIHSGITKSAIKEIYNEIRSAVTGRGFILFITHEAFMRLDYIERRDQWHLIVDEPPQMDWTNNFLIPRTHDVITRALILKTHDAAYGRLEANVEATPSLQTIVRNSRLDELWERFGDLGWYVLSPHWDVFSLQSNYNAIISNSPTATQLVVHAVLNPTVFEGFKQVIVASALFRETKLYRLWSARGEVFEPVSDALSKDLRYHQHANGALITIRYLLDTDWSKSLRDKPIDKAADGLPMTIKQQLPGIIVRSLEGRPFAWMANQDIDEDAFDSEEAERLPNTPHGLNSYQHLDHVVVLSALNATPAHFGFMKTRGVSAEELRTANYRSVVYQAAMRISIRDPRNTNSKTVTVMDADTAHWLAELFPGATVEKLDSPIAPVSTGNPGRPRRHLSNADKMRACRSRKRNLGMLKRTCDISQASEASFGTAYASIRDRDPLLYLTTAGLEAFVALLRECHRRRITSKEDNFLMSPAHFDPHMAGTETGRGLANIQYLNGVWLDNDGGSLTPTVMAEIFPQLRIIAWNTYSSSLLSPRWRCFIPTNATMTAAEYTRIVEQIIIVLKMHGYRPAQTQAGLATSAITTHGFDTGKFSPAALFYAPCQAQIPAESFFIDYHGGIRQLLDVSQWLTNDILGQTLIGQKSTELNNSEPNQPPQPITTSVVQDSDVTAAIEQWRGSRRGHGHQDFYRLACRFRRMGITRDRARHHLKAEARQANSPRDRLADASRLLGKLWRAR